MLTQHDELYRQLESFGWRKVEEAEPDPVLLRWWAREVWVLESLWRPQECRVYLTFVENPLGPSRNPWTVNASLEGPVQWSDVSLTLERPGRRTVGMEQFFEGLAGLRAAWQEAQTPPEGDHDLLE
jgi:hypothetical protein